MYNSSYFQKKYKKVISIYLNKHFFDIKSITMHLFRFHKTLFTSKTKRNTLD